MVCQPYSVSLPAILLRTSKPQKDVQRRFCVTQSRIYKYVFSEEMRFAKEREGFYDVN